jgi:hypothetical protein
MAAQPPAGLLRSVGVTIAGDTPGDDLRGARARLDPAYGGDGEVSDSAWVADITGLFDSSS